MALQPASELLVSLSKIHTFAHSSHDLRHALGFPITSGEILVWVGVWGMGVGSYATLRAHALAAASPVFEAVFLMQTSLPWLEKVADAKFAGNAGLFRTRA